MKRFLVFVFNSYCPQGGWNDSIKNSYNEKMGYPFSSFDTFDKAVDAAKIATRGLLVCYHVQIVDTKTEMLVLDIGSTALHRANELRF